MMRNPRIALFLASLFIAIEPHPAQGGSLLDGLAIDVKKGSREFVYTNKQSAFYYGETNGENSSSWQGFNVQGYEFVDDYALIVNGKPLERSSVVRTVVYPDYMVRVYPNGITETLSVAEGIAVFSVQVTARRPVDLRVIPYFTDGRRTRDYDLKLTKATALIARERHLQRSARENYPVWLAIYGKGFLPLSAEATKGVQFSPLLLFADKARSHTLAFAVADQLEQAEATVKQYIANEESYRRERRGRMERLLNETTVKTDDPEFDKALAWAKLSLDALAMRQGTEGIFAGLPWFNSYWGRDTFISLPGATLVTGRFGEAKHILRSFAAFQQTDSNSSDYGRIPNIVTVTDTAYNTADGTPRFVLMAKEYIERSGDSRFMAEIYPAVIQSIEGTLRYHVDSLGFLTHGDAETWMDAVGPEGPWSPRGNRANDVQALWAQQLDAGIWFATRVADAPRALRWTKTRRLLAENFPRLFVRSNTVADHLNVDGTPDAQLRPNQIFTTPLLNDSLRAKITRTVASRLTYEYGVASLSQDDDNFHPYHNYQPFYPKDAAYHNGTVWTWLQGPLISELCRFDRQDFAARLTENSAHQILDRGAVGTQSELLDAIPRPGEAEPRLSGTCSQAWNLAEFIRNFYDDYLGARVNLLDSSLSIRPRIPRSLGTVHARIHLGGKYLDLTIDQRSTPQTIEIQPFSLGYDLGTTVDFTNGSGEIVRTQIPLVDRTRTRLELRGSEIVARVNDQSPKSLESVKLPSTRSDILNTLAFVRPAIRPKLRTLKPPPYPLLSNRQIKADNPAARILVDADDPEGDDKGTGTYVYPGNVNFTPGCFDLRHFKVRYDSANAYLSIVMKSLSNPGWHPEYGFQLTFLAIALDTGGTSGMGSHTVRHNANYTLDSMRAYDRLILVGGGVQVEDAEGKALAAYIPVEGDVLKPLGNAGAGSIDFAIPLSYLGKPKRSWTFVVLSGGQDDHGGAGLGEFRTVLREVSEWQGGGKTRPDHPNVYDVLLIGPK